jgi:hypothetical protein
MSTRRKPSRGAKDTRLANRAREIRTRLRGHLRTLRTTPDLSKGASELAQRLVVIGAEHRLKLTRWGDLGQVDNDVLIGMTGAALLVALACGMSRREFLDWLRRTADELDTQK